MWQIKQLWVIHKGEPLELDAKGWSKDVRGRINGYQEVEGKPGDLIYYEPGEWFESREDCLKALDPSPAGMTVH